VKEFPAKKGFSQRREGAKRQRNCSCREFLAKTQRGVVASLREKKLPVVILKLNRISTVQECDARMMKKGQMPETKSV
jgi:hypothetical protein